MPTSEIALILAAGTGAGVTGMWLLVELLAPRWPRAAAAAGPSPAARLRLEGEIAATEWLVCDSPRCAHLSTPHRRDTAEYATCLWCGHITTEVSHG